MLNCLVLLDAQMPDVDGFHIAARIQQDPGLAGALVVMLTSAGSTADAARCRELNIKSYLAKPVKRADLLEAIKLAVVEHREPAQAPPQTASIVQADQPHFKILLAEDNIVNQKVALRFLEKRGHTVVLAETGTEALAIWQEQHFDLILMDVQMPDMDGLEVTALIRKHEAIQRGRGGEAQQQSAAVHIPIIAMTAHAMVGDRDRCLAAGMDDYVSKPIEAKLLFEAIDRAVPALLPIIPENIKVNRAASS